MKFANYFVVFLFTLVVLHLIKYSAKSVSTDPVVVLPPIIVPDPIEIKKEPEFIVYKPVKPEDMSLNPVLRDIESHLPNGHIYGDNDLITRSHESTHGINSYIRQKYSARGMLVSLQDDKPQIIYKALDRINAFYVLKDRAIILNEPNITIQQIAKQVPSSLRGEVFDLYLVKQASSWGDTPLYLLDEHSAYINGAECRKELKMSARSETVQYAFEFNVYIITLLKVLKENDPHYNDVKLKEFIMWQIERSFSIYNKEEGATNYWNKFKSNSDAKSLRDFAEGYFGKDWCNKFIF